VIRISATSGPGEFFVTPEAEQFCNRKPAFEIEKADDGTTVEFN
jgi:hypothetical protein